MFRKRKSQKPGDEFIANFRQTFPEVADATSTSSSTGNLAPGAVVGIDPHADRHHSLRNEELKDLDPTPRAHNEHNEHNEPWRFTPSILDPNSFAFASFANQPPGYYTPTPGGTNTLYHSQAGDLHTPGMGIGMAMGLGTPLSLSTSADGIPTSTMMDVSGFGSALPSQFHNYNPFGHSQPSAQPPPAPAQPTFAPSSLIHQDAGYETIEPERSPLDDGGQIGSMDPGLQAHSPVMAYRPRAHEVAMASVMPLSAEKFRFHVTLNAPTAMIKHPEEIPLTYLNKGQAYSISIVDTARQVPLPPGTRYRTFIRISFEDEQQRQRPATCWQLWKEGRGTNEAHQRGGKLQAVEYVEASQPVEADDRRTRSELDTASFDGFSVIWTPGMHGSAECNITVRFNFLSTDFSHSKGVKGIPVRLCAKTEPLADGSPQSGAELAEVVFCKVKLFRDHGAERKLSNDIAHVKKTIEKLKQQIAQAESGMVDFGKRKRTSSSSANVQASQRPGKVQKHKRTWSMSSASSSGGGRVPIEEDLHYKLQTMQDMFTSTRPISVLFLRGEGQDDPDLHPVTLPGEPLDLTKVDSRTAALWQQRSSEQSSTTGGSSLVSPSPSSISLHSLARSGASVANAAGHWPEFQSLAPTDITSSNPQQLASPPDQPIKVPRTDDTGSLNGWIEALGVDPTYKPPVVDHSIKPVACFFILHRDVTQPDKREYYMAIYLRQRTLAEFTNSITAKWNLEPSKLVRILHVLDRGLEVEMDDDTIRELGEGQDLIMELAEVQSPTEPLKREWEMSLDSPLDSGDSIGTTNGVQAEGYEIRLMF